MCVEVAARMFMQPVCCVTTQAPLLPRASRGIPDATLSES